MAAPLPPLAAIADSLRRRELSPVELVRASLERAAEENPRLNCLITIMEREALAAARIAEREILAGRHRGPLHGVPYTAKDVFATAGVRTTAGSRILADWVPGEDSTAVGRLAEAGAILIGKTNLSEFAAGPTNANEHFGPARNPWDPGRIPGGSSGGSAAAVAAGIGLFSLGTDTGGSVRIPAALCGTLGLKPSFGRVSRHGVVPLSWSLDTVGVLARDADESARVLEAIAGRDERDPATSGRPVERYVPEPTSGLAGVRVGAPRKLLAEPCHPEVRAGVTAALAELARLGAEVEEVTAPWAPHALAASNLIIWAESRSSHERWFPKEAARYGRHMRDQLLIGGAVGAADYLAALRVRRAIARCAASLFRRIDVLALPTVSIPAPPIGQHEVELAGERVPVLAALRRFTRLASATGQPALSVPCGATRDGLPVGLQLIGRMFGEVMLLRVARAYELSRPRLSDPAETGARSL